MSSMIPPIPVFVILCVRLTSGQLSIAQPPLVVVQETTTESTTLPTIIGLNRTTTEATPGEECNINGCLLQQILCPALRIRCILPPHCYSNMTRRNSNRRINERSCADQNDNCKSFRQFCNDSFYKLFMLANCAATCEFCSDTRATTTTPFTETQVSVLSTTGRDIRKEYRKLKERFERAQQRRREKYVAHRRNRGKLRLTTTVPVTAPPTSTTDPSTIIIVSSEVPDITTITTTDFLTTTSLLTTTPTVTAVSSTSDKKKVRTGGRMRSTTPLPQTTESTIIESTESTTTSLIYVGNVTQASSAPHQSKLSTVTTTTTTATSLLPTTTIELSSTISLSNNSATKDSYILLPTVAVPIAPDMKGKFVDGKTSAERLTVSIVSQISNEVDGNLTPNINITMEICRDEGAKCGEMAAFCEDPGLRTFCRKTCKLCQ